MHFGATRAQKTNLVAMINYHAALLLSDFVPGGFRWSLIFYWSPAVRRYPCIPLAEPLGSAEPRVKHSVLASACYQIPLVGTRNIMCFTVFAETL